MTKEDQERLALLDAAHEAMAAAEKACGAAGVPMLYSAIREERESLTDRAKDIAVGDEVRTHDVNFGSRTYPLVKVGPKRITLGTRWAEFFSRDTGRVIDNYGHCAIHFDDLARINRCFPRKAKP